MQQKLTLAELDKFLNYLRKQNNSSIQLSDIRTGESFGIDLGDPPTIYPFFAQGSQEQLEPDTEVELQENIVQIGKRVFSIELFKCVHIENSYKEFQASTDVEA